MTFTIKKKLGVLIGVLLALFVALGVMVYQNLQTIDFELNAIVTIHQPSTAIAYEMDVELLRVAYRVMGYLNNRDQGNFERLQDAEANFKRLAQEYSRLAEEDAEQELSRTIQTKFAELQVLGESLMARDDEQHAIFGALADRLVRWDAFITSVLKPTILTGTDPQASWKLEKIAELTVAFNSANRLANEFFVMHHDEAEARLVSAWKQCAAIIDQYLSAALARKEQEAVARLQELFQEIRQDTERAITLERQNQDDLEKFVLLRRELGANLLYEQAIKGTAEQDLLRAEKQVMQSVDASKRWLFIFLTASIAIALILGLSLAQNITSRLNHVVQAASTLSQGDLSVELRNNASYDEIGVLVVAFQRMIAYIRAVAHVAETIAQGNLKVKVAPQSERDVLNTSFQNMVVYLQDVAAVTEQVSNKELHVEVVPKSEHDLLNQSLQKMVANLRTMMTEIERQSWLKDGVSQLSLALSGDLSLKEVCQNAISFVCRYINAGSGTLYSFDAHTETLKLLGAFAFTERTKLSNMYRLGEGVVGQVALERAPILLKHPTRQEGLILTGTVSHVPAQTYTFPLIYENTLYGVIELAAMQPFDAYTQNFLNEANRVIATVLFSTLQREKVQELLIESQKAQEIAEAAAQEAEVAKYEAQEKAQEVQEANQQLEEQQQKLQQQSEELQQVNAHLEEQQQQLHQQSEELRQQNENLSIAKQQLDKRAADLEMASKYKSEFLANMSHELRTPLNSIILLSKMLSKNERQNLDDKEVKQVSVINQAGEELLRLINDILDLSKIESGKVTMNVTEFSIAELFQTFKDLFRSIAEEKGLEFIISEDFNAVLKTDRDKLSQILRNLLANAFKFTKQGSVTLRATQMPGKTDTVLIEVEDTGVGIQKEKQQLVFEAFQQADGSISREFGGTGLGLSIAREYAKLLQGAISLESEVGKGTTFTLTLPAMLKQIAEPIPVAPQIAPKPMAAVKKPQVFSVATEVEDDRTRIVAGDKVILIIEDNADLAQSTMDVTRGMGFKALVALTGHEGLELAAKFMPTGILLDLVLPDMNGMELLRELKSTRELRHIPVHIFSSKERDNSYRAIGAIGYYQKPVNEIDIQNAVDNLMAVSEKYPKRLLIVEDDETQREAIRDLLDSGDDVKITGVSSQTQAIAEIETGEYDAAIIDLGLKDGSGYDICRFIKERHVKLPVIIYTGRELTEEEERELRKYTDSIIIKTAKSYERLSDETSLFLHQMYHGETEQKPQAAAPKPLQAQGNLEGKKILIVDDDVKNVFVLASALENHGATVVDAKNGQVAIEVLNKEPDFDLVLMDVMMPVMDGYTAIRNIRKDDRFKRLPIIAITAKALKEDRQKCIQAGADDYLSKPVDYDGLIRLVKAWIEKE